MQDKTTRERGMLPAGRPDRALELQLELTRTGLQRLDTTQMEALGSYSLRYNYIYMLTQRPQSSSFLGLPYIIN